METSILAYRQIPTRPAQAADTRASRSAQPPAAGPAAAAASPGKDAAEDDEFGFLDVLSMLNPLQYLPVVGSIYRSVTGDKIPETVRTVGSLVVSGLLGGVVGVAISAASTALQKLVGFDPDEMAQEALVSLGLADDPNAQAPVAAAQPREEIAATPSKLRSRAHRAAYRLPVEGTSSRAQGVYVHAGEHVTRRRLATAAYARGSLACELPLGGTTLLDCSA